MLCDMVVAALCDVSNFYTYLMIPQPIVAMYILVCRALR